MEKHVQLIHSWPLRKGLKLCVWIGDKRFGVLKERGGFDKGRGGGHNSLGDVKERGRRGIPPTKPVVERFWGLGCSQETVVAPSQASHRAALGHPVIDRQTYQMAWLGQTERDLFIFHPLTAGRKLFSTSCLLDL